MPSVGDRTTDVMRPTICPLRMTRWHSFGTGPELSVTVKPTSLRVMPLATCMSIDALADVERLLLCQRPIHAGFDRVGEAVGVLADNDVALLQTQNALRLDAERLQADAACPLP